MKPMLTQMAVILHQKGKPKLSSTHVAQFSLDKFDIFFPGNKRKGERICFEVMNIISWFLFQFFAFFNQK